MGKEETVRNSKRPTGVPRLQLNPVVNDQKNTRAPPAGKGRPIPNSKQPNSARSLAFSPPSSILQPMSSSKTPAAASTAAPPSATTTPTVMMTPRGSYRDILCTPRGTRLSSFSSSSLPDGSLPTSATAAAVIAAHHHQQQQQQQQQHRSRSSSILSPPRPTTYTMNGSSGNGITTTTTTTMPFSPPRTHPPLHPNSSLSLSPGVRNSTTSPQPPPKRQSGSSNSNSAPPHTPSTNNAANTNKKASATASSTSNTKKKNKDVSAMLEDQTGRASVEVDHVRHQISTLETAIQAQQASLLGHIAVVQSLGQRRDELSKDAATLQAAVAQAQAVARKRQQDLEELEVLTSALRATLQSLFGNPNYNDGSTAVNNSGGNVALLKLMHHAATALQLAPEVLKGINDAMSCMSSSSSSSSSATGKGTAPVVATGNTATGGYSSATAATAAVAVVKKASTARSELSTSRFETPIGTMREEEEHDTPTACGEVVSISTASSSEPSSSSSSYCTSEDEEDDDRSSVHSALTTEDFGGGGGEGRDHAHERHPRPGVKLPPLALHTVTQQQQQQEQPQENDDTTVATATMATTTSPLPLLSNRPAALARLEKIRNKLEMAEAILTARVTPGGSESDLLDDASL